MLIASSLIDYCIFLYGFAKLICKLKIISRKELDYSLISDLLTTKRNNTFAYQCSIVN